MKRIKLLGLLTLTFSTYSLASGNPEFTAFALKQAHNKGFYICDTAIKNTFRLASGSDIRVNASWFNETKKDSIKLTAVYGSKGDSIFTEAEYRKLSGKCYVTETTIITTAKSCTAYASEMKAFNYVAETGDYIWMENKGGINMLLTPVQSSCVATFQRSNIL
ncbi:MULTISPECIES: hypothetical protein [Vibrio]|uniref:hypothetical protein n=1 Tax=Vibrio TaxID=662 RepID=UPI000B5CF3AB|nr:MULTISPECIES: hypothetical protein [Vibrio]HBV77652.1 hypothetical protein [Vibrio sp.]